AVTKAIPKKAANSKAHAKPRKAAIFRTNSVTTSEVKRAKLDADSDYEAPMAPERAGKKKTIKEIYQKKMHLKHILLRPDTYIGSTEINTQWLWIYDDTTDSLIEKDIQFVSSFFKIFDEVLVNATDNKVIPELIFVHLLTLSNYDDSEKKVVGNHNGYGAKPCNIFSTDKFQMNHLDADIVWLLK
ncbi:hypothetical protein L0F63_003436, partial [Massospora cicadina]